MWLEDLQGNYVSGLQSAYDTRAVVEPLVPLAPTTTYVLQIQVGADSTSIQFTTGSQATPPAVVQAGTTIEFDLSLGTSVDPSQDPALLSGIDAGRFLLGLTSTPSTAVTTLASQPVVGSSPATQDLCEQTFSGEAPPTDTGSTRGCGHRPRTSTGTERSPPSGTSPLRWRT